MAIHVRRLETWTRLADEALAPASDAARRAGCPRCAELGAAVIRLTTEVEQLRCPYAKAFREGASGALDFAARAFDAMGQRSTASILREMQSVVGSEDAKPK